MCEYIFSRWNDVNHLTGMPERYTATVQKINIPGCSVVYCNFSSMIYYLINCRHVLFSWFVINNTSYAFFPTPIITSMLPFSLISENAVKIFKGVRPTLEYVSRIISSVNPKSGSESVRFQSH